MEIVFSLFAIAMALVGLGWIFLLPLWALLRTRRIGELARRLNEVERELRDLRAPPRAVPAVPGPASAPVVEVAPAAVAAPVPPPLVAPVAPRRRFEAGTVEAWIGGRALGWVAVVVLLFAAAFFIQQAFENRWVGELGRVGLGVLAGVSLCAVGYRYHRRGWRVYSQMLTAAGLVLLYLAAFASFGYYRLIGQEGGSLFLVALVAEAALLAVLYEAPAVALMALVGGLLTPVLLHTGHDRYLSLFTYLLVLDAGMVALAYLRSWPAVGTVALVGSQALFWAWYREYYHPEKLAAALTFQAVLFSLFVNYGVAAHVIRPRRAGIEDLIRLVFNACLFGAALYVLLEEDYRAWLGGLALVLALAYTGLGWLVLRRRPDDVRQLFAVLATAMACVAAVFPLQARAAWIPVGWAVQGAVLWWFGLRVRGPALRGLGAAFLLLAVGRLVFVDTPGATAREPFIPILNGYGLPACAVAGCVLGAAAASRRFLPTLHPAEFVTVRVMGLGGVALLWFVLSVEAYEFFGAMAGPGRLAGDLELAAQVTLSVLWAAYAGVTLWAGFARHSAPLRWAALGLFAVTLFKALFVDMGQLPGLYRVAAFLALALVLGGAAWGYQKVQLTRRQSGQEVSNREAL